jgi:hypothetical protein
MSEHADARQRLHDLLVEATLKHFEGVGLRLQPCGSKAARIAMQDMAGLIAFSNDTLRGTMAFRAPHLVPQQSHPMVNAGPLASSDVHDWMGELTNGLLGRFKNLCAGRGLEFSMGIPSVVTGMQVELAQLSGTLSDVVHFECIDMQVDVSLDLVIDENTEVFGERCEQVMEEGALLEF